MKKIIALGFVLLLLMSGLLVTAQDGTRLESLRVGLWPEFDQPQLLVIYWGQLAEGTSYPAQVSLRIPARVQEPHVVAAQPAGSEAVDEVPYDVAPDGDWVIVTFETNGPLFQFEYYDTLNREGALRSPSYVWPGDVPVNQLNIELQRPPHADPFEFDPVLPNTEVSPQDGLTYFSGSYGPFVSGEQFTFSMNYARDTDDLTMQLLQALNPVVDTSEPVMMPAQTTSAASTSGIDAVLIVVVAVLGFLAGAATMRIAMLLQASRR